MIDIIIPLYNAKDTISKTLYSILLQKNLKDLHVYLVDDCSSCSYDEVISFFSNKMDLHYVRLEKNSGPGVARQYGIDHSNSPYIVFCDSDDVFYDCFSLTNLVRFMKDGNYDVSLGMVVEKYPNAINWYPVRFDVLHSKIYKRSYLKKHHIHFPELYNAEDLGFNNLVLMSGAKFGYCNYDTVYAYVRREGSLTQTKDYYPEKHIRSYIESLKWSVSVAEERKWKKDTIASVVLDSFCYLFFYFFDHFHAKDMKYVISAISIYDKYSPYMSEKTREKTLDFWLQRFGARRNTISFKDFISYCHKEEGEKHD